MTQQAPASEPQRGLTERRPSSVEDVLERRALALWPKLNREALLRCRHDPRRVAHLIASRTRLSVEVITDLLTFPELRSEETDFWFG